MKKIALGLVMLAALGLAGCEEENAIKAIEANGFTNVTLTGTPIFGCSDDDNVLYNKFFTATAANGKEVKGVACAGPLKGWTVRLTF